MKKKFDLEQYYNELVAVTLFDDGGDEDAVITMNGYNYIIKKGQTVEVPRKVAMIIEDSITQKREAKKYIASLTNR